MVTPLNLEILYWVLLFIALLIFYWLWNKLNNQWQQDKSEATGIGQGSGSQGSGSNSGSSGESTDGQGQSTSSGENEDDNKSLSDYFEQLRKARKKSMVEKLRDAAKDKDLADFIQSQAGKGSSDISTWDPDRMYEVAEMIGEDVLDMLITSQSKLPISMDLTNRKSTKLDEVRSGGIFRDTAKVRGPEDYPDLTTEELALDDDHLYTRISTGEARRVRRYDQKEEIDVFGMLRDRSGSMQTKMPHSGVSRDTWARGVVLRFARDASKGKVRFFFRDFDERVKPIQRVYGPSDVSGFIDYLVRHPAPADAGTNILNAISRMVKDIKADPSIKIRTADIVLISDGDDGSVSDVDGVREILGDVKLHTIVIGGSNPYLKAVSTTYKELR